MNRIKIFSAPHKALRKLMAEFSLLAGRTDYTNESELHVLKQSGNEMFELLKEHAHIEETIVLAALETKAPGSSEENKEEHELLEKVQEELEKWLNSFDGSQTEEEGFQFYLAFSSYHGQYLEHIIHEETTTQELLWKYFSEEELMGLHMQILQSIPFEIFLVWGKHVLPSQTRKENLAMLTGMKTMLPAPAFEKMVAELQAAVSPNEYYEFMTELEKLPAKAA